MRFRDDNWCNRMLYFRTVWLSYQADISISAALVVGVIPFIPADLAKILIAAFIGPQIRNRLIRTNLYKA